MIEIRKRATLGGGSHGWLNARHHFSFADYHDPARIHWGALRVWNDDEIAAKSGFPPHPHANMEIITYVRSGAISHRDSLGNVGRTEAGDVQVMSAGSGIQHAEYNDEAEPTTLFQIWILPDGKGGAPSWGTKPFPKEARDGKFLTLASGMAGDEDALMIRADARVAGASVPAGGSVEYRLGAGRKAYLVPAKGTIAVNGEVAETGDGAAVKDEALITITASEDAEIVLVDTV